MGLPRRGPSRRRVLRILAAAAAMPLLSGPGVGARLAWRGMALGADAEIILEGGTGPEARMAIEAARLEVERLEAVFSLYRPDSALVRLNRTGQLIGPPHDLVACLALARDVHRLSGGRFDPTVQPLFQAMAAWFAANDRPPPPEILAEARVAVGFDRVGLDPAAITLPPGGSLTLNGIAQGWITDRVAAILAARGYSAVLADLGEVRVLGPSAAGPWRIRLAGGGGHLLSNGALAVSAPDGLRFRGGPAHHLIDPLTGRSADRWHRIVVVAPTAAEADALSTGLASAPVDEIARLVASRREVEVMVRCPTGEEHRFP